MDKKAFIKKLLVLLKKQWPKPECEVAHSTALELMVGVILSAQSTDKRVNQVTPPLFKKYKKPEDWLKAGASVIEQEVKTTGFFRAKTKSILGACRVLVEKFNSKMPNTMDELLELPGIGRKSANVILGAIFGIPSGIVVDTHMIRLSKERLRLTTSDDPVKIEAELVKIVPSSEWIYFSQSMVLHGRYICVARKPKCFACELVKICPYPDKNFAEEPLPEKTLIGVPIRPRQA